MPAYAPNFTARYEVKYRSLGRQYSVGFRFTSTDSVVSPAEIAAVKSILDAAAPLRFTDWTVESADWTAQGSSVSVPVTPPVITAGTGAVPAQQIAARPRYISWVGRTFGGSRAAVFLFGCAVQAEGSAQGNDYRLTTVENSNVANVRNALIAAATSGLCGIDGGTVAWKQYANLGYNSFQTKKARGA